MGNPGIGGLGSQEFPEGDGVTQCVYRWNAVLPLAPRRAAQQICRPRLQNNVSALPLCTAPTAQPEKAGGCKGDTDHVPENRAVLVPADGSARLVFRHQDLLQIGRCDICEARGLDAELKQKRWHVVGLLQPTAVEVVPPAKRHHAPLAREAVKLEFLEGQAMDGLQQRLLLCCIEKVGSIPEAFRQ